MRNERRRPRGGARSVKRAEAARSHPGRLRALRHRGRRDQQAGRRTWPRSRGIWTRRWPCVVQSSSAAGKSSLMDAVLAFVPEEERMQYSAMTGQSLYYMGEMDLKHKVLAIVEEEGAARASYALKLLQSEGALSIASHRQGSSHRKAGHAPIPRGRPGDDLSHHHGDRSRRRTAQPLPGALGERGPRADAGDPQAATRAADARRLAAQTGAPRNRPPCTRTRSAC